MAQKTEIQKKHDYINDVVQSPNYQQYQEEIQGYLYSLGPSHFYQNYVSFKPPKHGSFGVINFLQNVLTQELVVLKAVKRYPRQEQELYWLWEFKDVPGYVRLIGYFYDTSPKMKKKAFRMPREWWCLDAKSESVWDAPEQLYMIMEYCPYTLAQLLSYDQTIHNDPEKYIQKVKERSSSNIQRTRSDEINEYYNDDDDEEERLYEEYEEYNEMDEYNGLYLEKIYRQNGWNVVPNFFSFILKDTQIVSLMFELYYAVYYGRFKLGYYQHLDLNVRNITIKIEESPREYVAKGHHVIISSIYQPVIIDFGISQGPWTPEKRRFTPLTVINPPKRCNITVDYRSLIGVLDKIIDAYHPQLSPESETLKLRQNLIEFESLCSRVSYGDEKDELEMALAVCFFGLSNPKEEPQPRKLPMKKPLQRPVEQKKILPNQPPTTVKKSIPLKKDTQQQQQRQQQQQQQKKATINNNLSLYDTETSIENTSYENEKKKRMKEDAQQTTVIYWDDQYTQPTAVSVSSPFVKTSSYTKQAPSNIKTHENCTIIPYDLK